MSYGAFPYGENPFGAGVAVAPPPPPPAVWASGPAVGGAWAKPASAAPSTLVRTTSGLIFRDRFDRPDSDDVGNGWLEVEDTSSSLRLLSEILDRPAFINPAEQPKIWRDVPPGSEESILQVNWAPGSNLSGFLLVSHAGVELGGGSYSWSLDGFAQLWRLNDSTDVVTLPQVVAEGFPWGTRLVVEKSGTSHLVRGYAIELGPGGLSRLDLDVALVLSSVQNNPLSTRAYGVVLGPRQGAADEFFICGRNIGVSGLPAGWKAQVDSRPAVVEVGGAVTFDVDAWALPATTVRVLDAADVQQHAMTPADGVWGGDEYLWGLGPGAGGAWGSGPGGGGSWASG